MYGLTTGDWHARGLPGPGISSGRLEKSNKNREGRDFTKQYSKESTTTVMGFAHGVCYETILVRLLLLKSIARLLALHSYLSRGFPDRLKL